MRFLVPDEHGPARRDAEGPDPERQPEQEAGPGRQRHLHPERHRPQPGGSGPARQPHERRLHRRAARQERRAAAGRTAGLRLQAPVVPRRGARSNCRRTSRAAPGWANSPGIERFRVKEPGGAEHTWLTARGACAYPIALQGRAGETLRVPVVFEGADLLSEVSLLEVRGGQFVKDWRAALCHRGRLPRASETCRPGDYSLYLKPEEQEIAVRVTQGEDRDGFTFSPRRALERPRLAPLAGGGGRSRGGSGGRSASRNATPFTRVHVFATRYLPAYDVFGRLGFTGAPALLQQPWRSARTFYESGRDIGDEYRYILDRQTGQEVPRQHAGPARPAAESMGDARHGDAGGSARRRRRLRRSRGGHGPWPPARRPRPKQPRPSRPRDTRRSTSCKQPAVVLLNLVPDKDGRIRIPRADLKGKPQLRILAVDPVTTRPEARGARRHARRDPRPAPRGGPGPGQDVLASRSSSRPCRRRARSTIADATTARFETYDTVAKAYRLLATLGGNPTFEEFAFIANWPDLDRAEKQRLYSKYACHELSFFLYRKDPEFFQTVIAPYLKNKKDKTFLDRWLLGEDLKEYLEPWRFGRLNIVGAHPARQAPARAAGFGRPRRAGTGRPDPAGHRGLQPPIRHGRADRRDGDARWRARSHRGTACKTGREREGRARRSGRPREEVPDEPAGARRSSGQASGGARRRGAGWRESG